MTKKNSTKNSEKILDVDYLDELRVANDKLAEKNDFLTLKLAARWDEIRALEDELASIKEKA